MRKYSIAAAALVIASCALFFMSFKSRLHPTAKAPPATAAPAPAKKSQPKIQAAILLDVSNSMDGLIEQAKAQLWNMVSVMGKAKCGDATPSIEIALYEYGRTNNDAKEGFVKQLSGFTADLDNLSQTLFNITTYGGDEYCGQVMYTSLTKLGWDSSAANYKVIFIAGNEDFLQGNLSYTRACTEAKKKGVIINTIYCGDRIQGIREHWNVTGECGNGSFTNINQDAKLDDIATPYDSVMITLNDDLNKTYIGYGASGKISASKQAKVDQLNYEMNKSVAMERVSVKSKKALYSNTHWDLVDAEAADSAFVNKVDMKTLPDSLQKKTRAELKQVIQVKNKERESIQSKITGTNIKRQDYIRQERAKLAGGNNNATLETEIEKIIQKQAKLFNMVIQ